MTSGHLIGQHRRRACCPPRPVHRSETAQEAPGRGSWGSQERNAGRGPWGRNVVARLMGKPDPAVAPWRLWEGGLSLDP